MSRFQCPPTALNGDPLSNAGSFGETLDCGYDVDNLEFCVYNTTTGALMVANAVCPPQPIDTSAAPTTEKPTSTTRPSTTQQPGGGGGGSPPPTTPAGGGSRPSTSAGGGGSSTSAPESGGGSNPQASSKAGGSPTVPTNPGSDSGVSGTLQGSRSSDRPFSVQTPESQSSQALGSLPSINSTSQPFAIVSQTQNSASGEYITHSRKHLSSTQILGIALGLVGGSIILCAILFYLRRRRRRQRDILPVSEIHTVPEHGDNEHPNPRLPFYATPSPYSQRGSERILPTYYNEAAEKSSDSENTTPHGRMQTTPESQAENDNESATSSTPDPAPDVRVTLVQQNASLRSETLADIRARRDRRRWRLSNESELPPSYNG